MRLVNRKPGAKEPGNSDAEHTAGSLKWEAIARESTWTGTGVNAGQNPPKHWAFAKIDLQGQVREAAFEAARLIEPALLRGVYKSSRLHRSNLTRPKG